jgi:hypothetical protein
VVEVGFRDGAKRLQQGQGRVVHQDVDAPEQPNRFIEETLELRPPADVRLDGRCFPAPDADVGHHGVRQLRMVKVVDTVAPSAASVLAIPFPIPVAAPVTIATRPASAGGITRTSSPA